MYNGKKILAIIPARGGSKGIPNKNIIDLCGYPLIYYTIQASNESKYIDKVIVSTDSEEIASVGEKYGAEVPFIRPAEISKDDSKSSDVVIHAIECLKEEFEEEYDYIILLQPTSPLRTSKQIDEAIEMCINNQGESLVSLKECKENPVLIRSVEDMKLKEVLKFEGNNLRRQDLPKFYIFNGAIYITSAEFINKKRIFVDEDTVPFIMDEKYSIDIDDEFDLKIAQLLLGEK